MTQFRKEAFDFTDDSLLGIRPRELPARRSDRLPPPMRLLDRHTRMPPALLLRAFGCALAALPVVVAAQPWSPLVRESRTLVISEVFFEAQSIREVDPGVFEIRMMYEPVTVLCLRRDRDGDCEAEPNPLLRSVRITVIRIRCSDQSYEEVAVWVVGPSGTWRQLSLTEYRHPPGWRYGIAPSTAVGAARDLVCATVPP